MSDFTSEFWSLYIAVITVVSIIGCGVFLRSLSVKRVPGSTVETMGHVWDGDLEEYNNPLPKWWMWLFYITLVFAAIYLTLYPGLGSYKGVFGWTSRGQYEAEEAKADARFGPIFDKYLKMPITEVAADPAAREMGQRLFLNYCAQCHASDARGSRGFPNLTDNDWLYGGDPETIQTTIMNGRNGMMPPLGATLGEEKTRDVANYVLSLSGRPHDDLRAARGKATFETICAACHGPDGKGNHALGAPNLTDGTWLYGGGESTIIETINKGRNGHMPAHGEFLGPAKVHLLAAYVWGLSHTGGGTTPAQ
ncbi:MAG: cytochrome-c oxidase, cbb3-type subunit III [Betaproteobacteria bacterium]|nr:cytochrome-c oxidase, cbb3-type subunit III [Betaproteobacteria bacterium]